MSEEEVDETSSEHYDEDKADQLVFVRLPRLQQIHLSLKIKLKTQNFISSSDFKAVINAE